MNAKQIVDSLNRFYKLDPHNIQTLLCIRLPTNQAIVDDPYFIAEENRVLPGNFNIGWLGILNGILSEHNSNQLVAMSFHEETRKFLGFVTTFNTNFKE
jgi:hypothetical protein